MTRFDNVKDDVLNKRMRFLSDRLEEIKNDMNPLIKEFEALSEELLSIIDEMDDRENAATKK